MSMLAGPRRKQKWTLNPRGKHWSEDSNKFGQKMLEKMGWTHGKGLGAKEQGAVEHIRVKVKNDQVGIGFDKNRDDQWTEHQDVFNSLLQNLQKEQNQEVAEENDKVLSGKSLEEKSKQSQKRVHYKKFTRGKDVNKYTTKDLANIFGKKDLNEKSVKEEKTEDEEAFYDPVGTRDTTAGILTIKGGNMSDYFQKKLHTDDQNQYSSQDKDNTESESELRTGFGFSVKSKSKFYVNGDADAGNGNSNSVTEKYAGFGFVKSTDTKSKVKNINNLNYVFDNPCLDLNILDESPAKKIKTEVLDPDYIEKVTPKKRKSDFIYDNGGLDLNCPDRSTPKKRKCEAIYDQEDIIEKSTPKKVKKNKNKSVSNVYENPALDLEFPDKSNTLEVAEENCVSNGIENPGLDLNFPDRPTPKKANNIKSEPLSNGIENPGLDLDFPDRPTPKKAKKIKNEPLPNGIENPALNLDFSDTPTPKKIKSIKSEPSVDEYENPALDLEYSHRSENIKSKKIKNEPLYDSYENPAMELDQVTPKKIQKKMEKTFNGIENFAIDLEYSDLPTPKKKIKHKLTDCTKYESSVIDLNSQANEVQSTSDFEVSRPTCGLHNNAFDDSDETVNKKRVTFNEHVEYNTDLIKKKKKKKKLDKYELTNEKSKKKSKAIESSTFVNEALDEGVKCAEEFDNEINEKRSKRGKRRKQRRVSLLETIEEAPEDENCNEAVIDQVKTSKEATDVEVIGEFACEDIEIITSKNYLKKKNKKKNLLDSLEATCENYNLEKTNGTYDDNYVIPNEISNKKKKKKRVKKEINEEVELNNQSGDYEKENINDDDHDTKNATNSIKEKKKKKSDDDVISLEEFLNEEESVQIKSKLKKQTLEDTKKKSGNIEISEENLSEQNHFSYQKFKTTKQVMKSLFLKNPTLMFNGSNINEIKGYGVETIEH